MNAAGGGLVLPPGIAGAQQAPMFVPGARLHSMPPWSLLTEDDRLLITAHLTEMGLDWDADRELIETYTECWDSIRPRSNEAGHMGLTTYYHTLWAPYDPAFLTRWFDAIVDRAHFSFKVNFSLGYIFRVIDPGLPAGLPPDFRFWTSYNVGAGSRDLLFRRPLSVYRRARAKRTFRLRANEARFVKLAYQSRPETKFHVSDAVF